MTLQGLAARGVGRLSEPPGLFPGSRNSCHPEARDPLCAGLLPPLPSPPPACLCPCPAHHRPLRRPWLGSSSPPAQPLSSRRSGRDCGSGRWIVRGMSWRAAKELWGANRRAAPSRMLKGRAGDGPHACWGGRSSFRNW